MKILAIGDFHGKFDKKWVDLIRKEKIDLVVSNGDYFPFSYRKIWFEHCFRTDVCLEDVVGKKKVKEWVTKDLRSGEKAISKLNKVPVPVITVIGNLDYTRMVDVFDYEKPKGKKVWKWYEQDFFSPIIRKYKNIKRFDYKFVKFGDFVFIGAYGGAFPGKVRSRAYKRYRKKLDKLFKKFWKENKKRKVIFVSHNVPYNTRIDKVTAKDADELVRGKHMGSKLIRRIIEKYQPVLHVGGHIHESWGKQKIRKTLCVNPGAAHEGRAAVVDIPEKGGRIRVRFVK